MLILWKKDKRKINNFPWMLIYPSIDMLSDSVFTQMVLHVMRYFSVTKHQLKIKLNTQMVQIISR